MYAKAIFYRYLTAIATGWRMVVIGSSGKVAVALLSEGRKPFDRARTLRKMHVLELRHFIRHSNNHQKDMDVFEAPHSED